jgi:RNA polymerase sigma-32 factor
MADGVSPVIQRYLNDLQAMPSLTREDEHELAVRVRASDDRASLDKLVRANLRHVVAIATKYKRYGTPITELVCEGSVGLVVAARRFDPDRGTRFVTYAAHWIRAFMLEHVMRGSSVVSGGSGAMRSRVFFRLRREKARLVSQGFGAGDVASLLAKAFGTTVDRLQAMEERLEARDVSLDAPRFDDESGALVDSLPSATTSQEDDLSSAEQAAALRLRVRRAVDDLDDRERFIVETRLLADAPSELSLAEIGRRLGVSRERARQLEVRAKQKMRKRLMSDEARWAA